MTMFDASDEVLLAGLADGDPEASRAFVRRYAPRAIGLANQLVGDRGTAEDVAQEALLRAWRHAATFDPRRGSVSTWVSAIVRNLAIDTLRLRRPEPYQPDALPLARAATSLSAESEAVRSDDAHQLRAALREVPVEQRRALVLAYAGLTAAEIAVAEQIPLGTAKTRIRIGLRRLRRSYLGDTAEEDAPS
jgi:RNA polymerase sigma-70 factor (ECF subfamily)